LIKQFQTQVIFVTDFTHKDKSRHAEEYLCDMADKLKIQYGQKSIFYMYGKKRPCMTCSARMKCSGIQYYNKHHGRLFMHGVNCQGREEAKETMKLLLKGPSYISEGGVTDYDTDSGDEDYDFTHFTNNLDKLNPSPSPPTTEMRNTHLSPVSSTLNVSK